MVLFAVEVGWFVAVCWFGFGVWVWCLLFDLGTGFVVVIRGGCCTVSLWFVYRFRVCLRLLFDCFALVV